MPKAVGRPRRYPRQRLPQAPSTLALEDLAAEEEDDGAEALSLDTAVPRGRHVCVCGMCRRSSTRNPDSFGNVPFDSEVG